VIEFTQVQPGKCAPYFVLLSADEHARFLIVHWQADRSTGVAYRKSSLFPKERDFYEKVALVKR
jgi:hypothetical protein